MNEEQGWLIVCTNEGGNTEAYLWALLSKDVFQCEGAFRWQPTVDGALQFARRKDAMTFIGAMRQLQQSLPYKDVFRGLVSPDERIRVAEHGWVGD